MKASGHDPQPGVPSRTVVVMRCHVCNVAVGDGQRFCHECGESLDGVTNRTEPLEVVPGAGLAAPDHLAPIGTGARAGGWTGPGRRRRLAIPMVRQAQPQDDSVGVASLGAGPADLTAARVLARAGRARVVFEAESQVGRIANTIELDGYRFDLGGHRFYTKLRSERKHPERGPDQDGALSEHTVDGVVSTLALPELIHALDPPGLRCVTRRDDTASVTSACWR